VHSSCATSSESRLFKGAHWSECEQFSNTMKDYHIPLVDRNMASMVNLVETGLIFGSSMQGVRESKKICYDVPVSDMTCKPKTQQEKDTLAAEVRDYEKSYRFQEKIQEAQGQVATTAGHVGILQYLPEKVLQPGWSILELGCAAGGMLTKVAEIYDQKMMPHGKMVGVELVGGWVRWASQYYKQIDVYEGDITEFALPAPHSGSTFDFVMLNDVVEHIQKGRYGCLFSQLASVTHPGSIVYMHTPSPAAQIIDQDQYYEHIVPHHFVVSSMAAAGFELISFEYDINTECGGEPSHATRQVQMAKCNMGGFPKYTHNVYRRVSDARVMTLS